MAWMVPTKWTEVGFIEKTAQEKVELNATADEDWPSSDLIGRQRLLSFVNILMEPTSLI